MFNKRGASGAAVVKGTITALAVALVVFVFVMLGIWILVVSGGWDIIAKEINGIKIDSSSTSFGDAFGGSYVFFGYIFGGIANFLFGVTSAKFSPVIITISIWLLLFVTFGDILATFGPFSTTVSWLTGFLLAVIAANLNFVVIMTTFFIGIVSFMGAAAVVAGVGLAFVTFFAVNFGITSFAPFMMRRKMMLATHKSSVKTLAGGKKIEASITAIGDVGRALRTEGEKK